jgi:LPXTG-site transpeptidase (sortase) family protein
VALPQLLESAAESEPEQDPSARGRWRRREPKPPRDPRPPRPERPELPQRPVKRRPTVQAVGVALTLTALLVLGFFVYLYGLSGLSEQRAQTVMYKSFAGQLAEATAPTGPTSDGSPVAILNIPALGITDMVVVEGTSAEDLTHGPGHVRASVLPGQYGVSVVYGRISTYGAPFAHLMRLQRGDRITATTGQGTATYIVESFGTTKVPSPDPTRNRLILETGGSAAFPTSWVQVSADLWSGPQPTPSTWPQITAQEVPLAGNPNALVPLVFWAQALVLVSIAGAVAANQWSRWPALLCTAPAALALIWAVYENLSLLLPNLY